MEAVQSNHVQEERAAFRHLLWVGPLAAAAAAVANAFVYLVASVSGAMPQDFVVNGQGPITLVVVAAVSVQGAAARAIATRSLAGSPGGSCASSASWRS